ncbi:hypothetical protein FBQ82_06320 [Anaerolineae bacterium CFX7]|nr:hypothetical protein [Anaerolineae bacterium CFX7]
MISSESTSQLYGRWLTLAHAAWYVCAALAVIVLLAALPVYVNLITHPDVAGLYGLGPFSAPFRILVDAGDYIGSVISFALALLLFWRKPNDRMALFVSFFCLITAITGLRVLDHSLTAYFGAPPTYEVWSNLQTPLWILLFCIFPDGRFVPRWTRWLFVASLIAAISIFALPNWREVYGAVSTILVFLAISAQIYRYRRVSSFAERQQTKWWLYGLAVAFVLAVIALLVYHKPTDPLLNVTPVFLTIAILRSRLWDIDIIIRKTVTYTLVTSILGVIFLGSIIGFQQIFSTLTNSGQNEIVTVISTLVIAALFVPLRYRIQNVIDKHFYRKKYDAQQVLQKFAETVRDETDLEKLTAELVNVVQETMQPKSVSVWLKRTTDDRRRTID